MRVGVIIPFAVDRGWLDEAIESVYEQSYEDIYLSVQESNNSVGYNINKGVEDCLESNCELIRYLCEDDMLTPNSIEDTVNYFKQNPEDDFIHGNAITLWDLTGRKEMYVPPVTNPTLSQMIANNRLHGGTVVYRSKCFEGNRFDESLWTGEEYDFNMNLMKEGFKIGYLNRFTYIYRRHSEQKSLGNVAAEYQNKRRVAIEQIKNRYR